MMILTLPIGDDYSEFLAEPEHNGFPHSTSKKFEVITDDFINFELDDSGYQQLKKIKFKAVRHNCSDFKFLGHSTRMEMNVLNGIVDFVKLTFNQTDTMMFSKINECLNGNLGNFIRRSDSDGLTVDFDEEPREFSSTTFFYKKDDYVFEITKSGHPNSTKPFITLTVYTRTGYYSLEDFNKTYERCSEEWSQEYEKFASNFSIDGL